MIEVVHNEERQSTGILLHGLGSHAGDLQPIAQAIASVHHWLLPQGFFSLGDSVYAWFLFPEEHPSSVWDFSSISFIDPPDLTETAKKLARCFQHIKKPCIVAGFSQGSMLAVELTHYMSIDVLILFSSALIAEQRWKHSLQLHGVSVFQSHGYHDDVLSIEQGKSLEKVLQLAGAQVTFCAFDGGHSISDKVISELIAWLQKLALDR